MICDDCLELHKSVKKDVHSFICSDCWNLRHPTKIVDVYYIPRPTIKDLMNKWNKKRKKPTD